MATINKTDDVHLDPSSREGDGIIMSPSFFVLEDIKTFGKDRITIALQLQKNEMPDNV